MSHSAMEENSTKQTDFQKQLYMRNDQISELPKEIMQAEQDRETSGDFLADMTSISVIKSAFPFRHVDNFVADF